MKNRKKKRFKLIRKTEVAAYYRAMELHKKWLKNALRSAKNKLIRNDIFYVGILDEPTFTISSAFKVEAMTLKDGETLADVFKENESIGNLKEAVIKAAKACAERLKALAEIELQNQNHKPI